MPDASRLYAMVFVVVAFSVLVQGGTLPVLAARLRVPMRLVEPEPFSRGVRLREEPDSLRRLVIAPGAPADGASIDLLDLDEGVWISIVLRGGRLLELTGRTVVRAGDEVLILGDSGEGYNSTEMFDPTSS